MSSHHALAPTTHRISFTLSRSADETSQRATFAENPGPHQDATRAAAGATSAPLGKQLVAQIVNQSGFGAPKPPTRKKLALAGRRQDSSSARLRPKRGPKMSWRRWLGAPPKSGPNSREDNPLSQAASELRQDAARAAAGPLGVELRLQAAAHSLAGPTKLKQTLAEPSRGHTMRPISAQAIEHKHTKTATGGAHPPPAPPSQSSLKMRAGLGALGRLSAGLLLLLLPLLAGSQQPQQYFEVQPEAHRSVASGQEARLRCLVRNRQGECAWIRNGQVIGPIRAKYAYARQPDDGDCSILIRNASVQLDDGQWQCQVLATDLEQPALQSRQASLLVLVAPERPQIKELSQPNQRLVVEEKATKTVVCEMRGGNPAPQFEWLLDGRNVSKEASQSSAGAAQRVSQSRLRLSDVGRQLNGKNLTCIGLHPTQSQSTSVELDVQYPPSVSVGQREYSIVEGSPLSISCQVDANPAPSLVSWRLVGGEGAPRSGAARGPLLEFAHIGRESNQAVYECWAQNARGQSAAASARLNVLFAPAPLNSSRAEAVQLGADAHLECRFEGNPRPDVRWLYADPLSKSAAPLHLDNDGRERLAVRNATYRDEGDYHCEARNYINGQPYAVRSSSMQLDVFGEPQFLTKTPLLAKAMQASAADLALSFCADPPPSKAYWQFGSIRLDVRLNSSSQQPGQAQLGPNQAKQQQQVAAAMQRFQVHPLQPIQRRDSNFSKVKTCFEATLTLMDPELTDQRDYTLNVFNERGHQSATIRLRVSTPLSPVLMISTAFVTICGIFLCSLLFIFVFKKKQHFLNERRRQQQAASNHNSNNNGNNNNIASDIRRNGSKGSNGKLRDNLQSVASTGGSNAKLNAGELSLSSNDSSANAGQQHQSGIVNGHGNGLANGASNPNGSSYHNPISALDSETTKALHLMSMASSDTSCNDQKQLLASPNRNSSTSSGSIRGNGPRSQLQQQQQQARNHSYHINSAMTSSDDRSTANSTPTTSMNHISVDEELNLNGTTYRAAESVTQGARLSPITRPQQQQQLGNGLIYANLTDYSAQTANSYPHKHHQFNNGQVQSPDTSTPPIGALSLTRQPATLKRSQLPQNSVNTNSPIVSDEPEHNRASPSQGSNVNNDDDLTLSRPSVGATIAMMNSLAAAAAATTGATNHQCPNSPAPGGVLNGAINQQFANNRAAAAGQARRPGPPKPPKPSIQQRSRFYQQQVAANGTEGLIIIGQQPGGYMLPASQPISMDHSSDLKHHDNAAQVMMAQHQVPMSNDFAAEYSRLAFPTRAEL